MIGRVHSIETLGAVDGPGVRCVVFLQGCPLRCQYCHNVDTWDRDGGQSVGSDALLRRIRRMRPYFGRRGGVTFSGGEPLAQPAFLRKLLLGCRREGIHTAIDTSGCTLDGAVRDVLDLVDLVILDIKHTDPARHRELTGADLGRVLEFLEYLAGRQGDLWVRQVIVPGISDAARDARDLAALLAGVAPLRRVELLAYHQMGQAKWQAMGRPYPLAGVQPPSPLRMRRLADAVSGEIQRLRPRDLSGVDVAATGTE